MVAQSITNLIYLKGFTELIDLKRYREYSPRSSVRTLLAPRRGEWSSHPQKRSTVRTRTDPPRKSIRRKPRASSFSFKSIWNRKISAVNTRSAPPRKMVSPAPRHDTGEDIWLKISRPRENHLVRTRSRTRPHSFASQRKRNRTESDFPVGFTLLTFSKPPIYCDREHCDSIFSHQIFRYSQHLLTHIHVHISLGLTGLTDITRSLYIWLPDIQIFITFTHTD